MAVTSRFKPQLVVVLIAVSPLAMFFYFWTHAPFDPFLSFLYDQTERVPMHRLIELHVVALMNSSY
jgi:hypothetical protein